MAGLVDVENLTVSFRSRRRASLFSGGTPPTKALDDVSITIEEGETFGLTGETGSGKSTLAKVLVGLHKPSSGIVRLNGRNINYDSKSDISYLRRNVGIVLQDPVRSLNPRLTVKEIIAEALIAESVPKREFDEKIDHVIHLVGVTSELLRSHPRELSGGQKQRVSLARALVVPKRLLILDEPTSSLDVSIQAQVLNTLKKLKSELDLSYLFITHDINVIKYVSRRLGVLFYGKLVEVGDTRTIAAKPKHPYTRSLMWNVLTLRKARPRKTILSEHRPASTGCRYRIVCPHVFEKCAEVPPAVDLGGGHRIFCFLPMT